MGKEGKLLISAFGGQSMFSKRTKRNENRLRYKIYDQKGGECDDVDIDS